MGIAKWAKRLAGAADPTDTGDGVSTEVEALEVLPEPYLERLSRRVDSGRHVPRTGEQERFREVFQDWKAGCRRQVAVIGKRGEGKTTFLQDMDRMIHSDAEVETYFLQPADKLATADDLRELLRPLFGDSMPDDLSEPALRCLEGRRAVVFFDDAHHSFLRTVGGFQALHALLWVMTATCRNILWVTAWDRLAGDYWDSILRVPELISHQVVLEHFAGNTALQLVEDRLANAPFHLLVTEDLFDDKSGDKLVAFFEQLTRMAEGNPSIILALLARSSTATDPETLVLRPLHALDIDASFNDEELYAAAGLMQSGALSPRQMTEVINVSLTRVQTIFFRFERLGLTERLENGLVALRPEVYRPLLKLLSRRRVIYLKGAR